MLQRLSHVACVLWVVAVLSSVGAAQADSTVYNANADMIASEAGGSPSGTFGPWTIGWADPLTLPATAPIGDRATYSVSGWGRADNSDATYVCVNSLGAANESLSALTLAKDEMVFHPGNLYVESDGYAVLNWTAPRSGTININTAFRNASTGPAATSAVFVGKNYSWLYGQNYSAVLDSTTTSLSCNLTGISVAAGDIITVDVGSYTDNVGDYVGVFHTITYVPEPASLAMLVTATAGLLCYAWRKRG